MSKKPTSVTAECELHVSEMSVRAVRYCSVCFEYVFKSLTIFKLILKWFKYSLMFVSVLISMNFFWISCKCKSRGGMEAESLYFHPIWSISQQRCFLYRLNHTVYHRVLRSAELWVQHAVSVRGGVGGLLEGSVKELLLPSTSPSLFYRFEKCVECKSMSSTTLWMLPRNAERWRISSWHISLTIQCFRVLY